VTAPARVGLIIPSSNRLVEDEMVRWFPPDVHPHIARLRMTGPHRVPIDTLVARVEEAAGTLDDARCAAVVFHCTATSMDEGADGAQRLLAALRRGARGTCVATATALLQAFAATGIRRVVLVTPYDRATTDHEAAFLRDAGIEVVQSVAMDRGGSDGFAATPPQFWYDTVRGAAHPDADGYFLSCANIACFEQIEPLEAALDRPMITSNQAVLWWALRAIRKGDRPRLGRLFDTA